MAAIAAAATTAQVSHFDAMLLFAALVTVALTALTRRTTPQRIRFAVSVFIKFVLVAIALGWLMYPFSR
jgi:hypothetical protein